MDMTLATRHEVHAQAARARFGRSTPYRLGLMAGFAGDTLEHLPNPYSHGRARTLYAYGVEEGQRERTKVNPATQGAT